MMRCLLLKDIKMINETPINNDLPSRKTHRLKEYDYGQYGYYFVTVCTNHRKPLLSRVVGNDALVVPSQTIQSPVSPFINGTVIPSHLGEKVLECWQNIERLNKNVELDKFVMMPNHIHGIIIIKNTEPIHSTDKTYGFELAERRVRIPYKAL